MFVILKLQGEENKTRHELVKSPTDEQVGMGVVEAERKSHSNDVRFSWCPSVLSNALSIIMKWKRGIRCEMILGIDERCNVCNSTHGYKVFQHGCECARCSDRFLDTGCRKHLSPFSPVLLNWARYHGSLSITNAATGSVCRFLFFTWQLQKMTMSAVATSFYKMKWVLLQCTSITHHVKRNNYSRLKTIFWKTQVYYCRWQKVLVGKITRSFNFGLKEACLVEHTK